MFEPATYFQTFDETIKYLDDRSRALGLLLDSMRAEQGEATGQALLRLGAKPDGQPHRKRDDFTPDQLKAIDQRLDQVREQIRSIEVAQEWIEVAHRALAKPPPAQAELWASVGAKNYDDLIRQMVRHGSESEREYARRVISERIQKARDRGATLELVKD